MSTLDVVCLNKLLEVNMQNRPGQGACRHCPGNEPSQRINCKGYSPVELTSFGNGKIVRTIKKEELIELISQGDYI